MISPTWNCIFAKSSKVISSFASMSMTGSSSFFSSAGAPFAAVCAARISSAFFRTSSRSFLANRISGFSVTFVPDTYLSKVSNSSISRRGAFSCAAILSAVSGINGASRLAPIMMLSVRLYITSARRGFVSSLFARVQGIVSSIYLLQRLNRVKISVRASATRSLSIFSAVFFTAPSTTAFRSSSTGSVTPLASTTPPKYLLLMEIVRFTRLPSTFARSEFIRSTISSQLITPSFSNGISCRTK